MSDTANSILTGKEILLSSQEEDNYLIESILWENQVIMVLAREKVGKSILTLQMACSLSCGEAFLGEYEIPYPMPILYIQTESSIAETAQRLKAMSKGIGWKPENFNLLSTHSLELDNPQCLEWIVKQIDKKKIAPKVIFLDPLYMSMKGSLNDDESSRALSRHIRQLGDYYKASVVVVHHEHRQKRAKDNNLIDEGDNSIMGSFVWKAFPNHVVHLRIRPDKIRTLSCNTQRSGAVIDEMLLELCQPNPLHYKVLGTPDHQAYMDTVLNYFKINEKGHAKEISELTGLSLSAVKKSLAYFTKFNVNKLKKINAGSRPTYYALSTPS